MKIETRNKIFIGFSTISFSGVLFLLLLFFIQSSSASISVLNVQLPVAESRGVPVEGIFVVITMEGRYFLNKEEISKDGIESELKRLLQNKPSPTFVIAADSGALYGDVVYLLEIASKNRYKALMAIDPKK